MIGDSHWTIDRGEDVADLLLHEIAEACAASRAGLDGLEDAIGGGDADVG